MLSHQNQRKKIIVIKNLSKSFPANGKGKERIQVLQNINLEVDKGELVCCFFGPNASGKTTLLNIVAGLIDYDEGEVLIQGKKPGEAKIGYIFQNYQETLFPWRKNIDNIAFPLELKGMPKAERHKRVLEFEEKFEIRIDNASYPYELSSGQQQMVAIARALIDEPDILLMDEPFSALDFQNRIYMQDKVLDIWERSKVTVLFVSHEIDEAIYLSNKILFFSQKPARIMDVIENPLPHPRHQRLVESEEFFILRNKALSIFRRAIRE